MQVFHDRHKKERGYGIPMSQTSLSFEQSVRVPINEIPVGYSGDTSKNPLNKHIREA